MEAGRRQPSETSRDRRRRETREALLAAAYDRFCDLGYAGTSLDDVAHQAGFTKGAVYTHFDGKEGLFLALIERSTASLVAGWVESDLQSAKLTDVDQLSDWLSHAMREQREWFLVTAEFAVLAARRPALAVRQRESVNKVCTEIAAWLVRIGVTADAPGLATMSRLVLAMMNGLVLHEALDETVDAAADFRAGLNWITGQASSEGAS